MHNYEYTVEARGPSYPSDAYKLSSDFGPEDLEWVAEDAGRDYWNSHDGWECRWPLKFEIFAQGKSLGRFEVGVEVEPTFSANQIEDEPGTEGEG